MATSIFSISILLFFLSLISLSFSSASSHHPQTFVVFVSKSHKPTLFSSHHDWFVSIVNSLPSSHHQAKVLYTYAPTISGFAAHLTSHQAAALSRVSGIISVLPDQIYELHTTHTPHFLGFSPSSGLMPKASFGEDMVIGVLDTGVWPEHPSYSDSGLFDVPTNWKGICETSDDFPASSCNKKLIGARAYYKSAFANRGKAIFGSANKASPRDTQGHGTHTSTTAGGSLVKYASFYQYARGTALGMAPKARIAAYKICWPETGCYGADILAAIAQAIEDGVHVISKSVGPSSLASPYYLDTTAVGAFAATSRGVVVSCSAGNTGPNPNTAVNVAPWILTIGASTVDREFRADVVLGNGKTYSGFSLYTGEPLADEMFPLVYGDVAGDRFCSDGSLDSSKVQGKIVICDNGRTSRLEKGNEVKRAGGVGMIIRLARDEPRLDGYLTPATNVGLTDGNHIIYYSKWSESPTAKIVFRGTVIGDSPPSPKVASFSSRGPNYITPEILKPDVIAPGVSILAGWTGAAAPTNLDNDDRRVEFWVVSGTSMACPHVSGIAALLRKAYPSWSPAAIKSALMTTAYNFDNSGQTIGDLASGKESTPFVRGAEHVDPNAALDPGLVYDINTDDYVSFLCAIGYTRNQIGLFISETPPEDICENNMGNPGNLNLPSFAVVFDANTSSVAYQRTVKNVGSPNGAVYDVKINAPANVYVKVFPTTLEFSEENQSLSYAIMFSSATFSSGSSSNSLESFGSIEWSHGTHTVKSPIAVTWKQGVSVASI
ncbi:subtilisin-like protease SBT1.4 [Euphorbia lathyris]|uniref:subtilisin-like protease SBT1.4 n=1 Tax=Euphorbia lathyris TaxID=212925 RepID=UPI0033131843